jgi:hypothetical protein
MSSTPLSYDVLSMFSFIRLSDGSLLPLYEVSFTSILGLFYLYARSSAVFQLAVPVGFVIA